MAANGTATRFGKLSGKPQTKVIHGLIGGVNRIDFETAPQLESKTEQLLASGRYREVASAALSRARQNVREELSQRSHTSMGIRYPTVDADSIRVALVFLFIAQFGIGATNPQLELFVGHVEPDWAQGKVQQHTAYLFSILAGVGLFAMPVWGRYGDRNGHGKVLVISALSAGIALCVSGFATAFWVLLVSRLLLGAFGSGLGPAAFGLAADVTGREERGAANGAVFSARALAISLGSIVGGVLVHFLGLRGIYIGSGCLLVIAVFAAGPRLLVRRADS